MKIIDNFLDEEYFNNLVNLFIKPQLPGQQIFPWEFSQIIATESAQYSYHTNTNVPLFYMVHIFFQDYRVHSLYHEKILPLLKKMEEDLELKALIRTKANLFPNTSEGVIECGMHSDYSFSHFGAVLSLNTCDGYTKFLDGTKVESVANRIVVFDASEKHCSTTTTNVTARFNININYL